jgi:hypothetical protein
MKPTKEVLQAMTNLRVSSDFEVVLEWLRNSRKTARDELENQLDEQKFARVQGRALALKVILDTNENAPALLAKYKDH